eukprot:gb/GFBE01057854.1/.p1 GENE.gb/GFBE01057854.1/~~gb/GFBE01057854.1/.p1  ORF type:complete len:1149 (+),score=234.03 gb/GFBE01057854.1/:1-3447(+)
MGSKQSVEDDASDAGMESPMQSPKATRMVAPQAEVMVSDLSSKILLSMRCEALAKGKNSIVVVYTKIKDDPFWTEVGVSEICGQDTRYPVWEKPFEVEFRVEQVRLVRAEVYIIRKQNMIEDLMEQKFVGSTEFILNEAMMARANEEKHGWLVKKLETHQRKRGAPPPGRLAAYAEESNTAKVELYFKSRATGLQSTDFFKRKCDPYFVVNRLEVLDEFGELELKPCFRSEVARRTSDPTFGQCRLTAAQTCGCQIQQDIIITVHDWFRLGNDKYIGECVLNFEELQKAAARGQPLTMPICRRDGPRIQGMTRIKTTAAHLRSATKGSRSASRSTSGSRSGSNSRGRPSKDSGGRRGTASKEGAGSRMSSLLSRASGRRSSSLSSSGSGGSGSESDRADRKSSRLSVGSQSTVNTGSGSQGTHLTSASMSSKPGQFGPVMGHITLEEFGLVRACSFLDYVRGGLELRLNVAIDFTRSNLGQSNPYSYHSTVHKDEESAYATAIRALGEVIQTYDTDDMYPVYGFGAKIPPSHSVCSNCFALTGDFFQPEVEGVDGILKAYQRALQVCHLHGPSYLSDVIRLCANLARPYIQKKELKMMETQADMKYFVMLILTDGDIEDHEQVIREIKECDELPLSIIIVGIGNKEFTFLRELARDIENILPKKEKKPGEELGTGLKRSLVRFIAFKDFREDPSALAAATLSELPKEVVGYYAAQGIKPRNVSKFEDAAGNPLPKHIPKEPASAMAKGAAKPLRSGTRSGTNDSPSGSTGHSRSVTNTGSKSPMSGSKSPGQTKSRSGSHSTDASSQMLQLHGGSDISDDEDPLGWLDDDEEAEEEQKRREKIENLRNNLPIFLQEEKERLIEDGVALGYDKFTILRAIRDGVPSASLDVLVDNIMNGGYGKSPSYKDAALAAIPDEATETEMSLPGQPVEDKSSPQPSRAASTAAGSGRRMSGSGTDYAATLNALANQSQESAQASRSTSRMSLLAVGAPRRGGTADGSSRGESVIGTHSKPSKDPWAGVKIEDGSAARTLLEVSASRSRDASKELGALAPIRTTTKTLEEVAGRLGALRTTSKGPEQRRPSIGTVAFHTITEDDQGNEDSVVEVSFGPRAAGSNDAFDMAKTMPEGAPWKKLSKEKTLQADMSSTL